MTPPESKEKQYLEALVRLEKSPFKVFIDGQRIPKPFPGYPQGKT